MWQFQYKHGDRPLEGFTIQRAAGRGGFGEVYYALSDGGREVALKAVTGYEQIELRGISQCMNLKNPHLVSIHDVKYNDQGRPFVIMEFVAGPNLRQILDESPGGLGAQKAAFFLREMGKGLTFLHDCGIVHRDLKPANVFFENGYVKIGDYGLSKAIAPTQHSGQTITVGTVHYMAPEIGGGKYDKSIDIYALGAVLYEMLTGQPPFLGGSAGEILMKHVATEPEVAGIEEPFRAVIKKAMAKNPAERYQTVQEMIEGVFGSEHIQQSVSCFRPESLSMIADRVARRVAVGGGSATPPPIPPGAPALATAEKCWDGGERLGRMIDRFSGRMGRFGNRLGMRKIAATATAAAQQIPGRSPGDPSSDVGDPLCDPLSRKQRWLLSVIMLVLIAVATAAFSPAEGREGNLLAFWAVMLGGTGATVGTLLAGRKILPQMNDDSGFLRRLASGGTAGAFMMVAGIPCLAALAGNFAEHIALTGIGALITLLLLLPPDLRPSRSERVAFGNVFLVALFGFGVWVFTQGNYGLLVAVVSASNLLAQLLSPWDPFAARRKMGLSGSSAAAAPSPVPTYPQVHTKDSAMPYNPAHPADAPTLAWMSSPPPVPAGNAVPAGETLSRRERRRERRRLRKAAWNEAQAWRVRTGVPFYVRLARFVRGVLVGTSMLTLLVIATIAALFLALDIPGMLAAGVLDPDMPREMTQYYGFSRWPQMFRGIGYVAAWVPMMMAAGVLILSRRSTYGLHMLRGVAGVMTYGLALVLLTLATARSSWLPQYQAQGTITNRLSIDSRSAVVTHGDSELEVEKLPADRIDRHRGGDDNVERVMTAFLQYGERTNGGFLVATTGATLLALLLMCWPARQAGGNGKRTDADDVAVATATPAPTQA